MQGGIYMVQEFLKLKEDETLLMYMSEGYANNSGQGDNTVIGNVYSMEEINSVIENWENEVSSELRDTNISVKQAYSTKGIDLTKLVYSEKGETKDIIDDTDENKKELENIKEKCEYDFDNFEILDIIHFYAKAEIVKNELNLRISFDTCYQNINKNIIIKKVNKCDVRYCVIIERPVSSRENGQYILAGPYINCDEAKSLVKEFSPERDIYGVIRKPYIIATFTDDIWLKNHYKKNGK
jgi:hypothetical protein